MPVLTTVSLELLAPIGVTATTDTTATAALSNNKTVVLTVVTKAAPMLIANALVDAQAPGTTVTATTSTTVEVETPPATEMCPTTEAVPTAANNLVATYTADVVHATVQP